MLWTKRGMGLVEIVVALAVLLVMALGIFSFIGGSLKTSKKLEGKSLCDSLASTLVTSVKSRDNALTVRNSIPLGGSNPKKVGTLPGDPICPTGVATGFRCDSKDLYGTKRDGTIDLTQLGNIQNIRGASTWAMNLFNNMNTSSSGTPAICSTGLRFTKAGDSLSQLQNYLLSDVEVPEWVDEISMQIQALDPANGNQAFPCSSVDRVWSPTNRVGFNVAFTIKHKVQLNGTFQTKECSAETDLSYHPDDTPPTVLVSNVVNGIGEGIPQFPTLGPPAPNINTELQCTCRKPWDPGACPEMYEVHVNVEASEPGVLFLCKRVNPTKVVDSDYKYCGDMQGQIVLASKTLNDKTRARITFSALIDGMNRMEIVAVDSSGNMSAPAYAGYFVNKPFCPPQNSYCPGDQPDDGCNNACPNGTAPNSCPNPGGFCGGPVTGSCGGGCPDGTYCPDPCAPGCPPSNTYCPGTTVQDACGRDCPNGTKVCPPGDTDPDVTPTPSCTPAPYGTKVSDPKDCCGTGIYYCKERTGKWIKDWKYDRFCCVHDGCFLPGAPREDLDDVTPNGSCLHACTPSNKPRPRCWNSPKDSPAAICLGPKSVGRGVVIITPSCINLQTFCGNRGHWHDDWDGGRGNRYESSCRTAYSFE